VIENSKIFMTDNGFMISEHMLESIRAYITKGCPVGSFLQAVIANELTEACLRADDVNIRNLPAFAWFFYDRAPRQCWGSREAYKAWVELRGLEGLNKQNPNPEYESIWNESDGSIVRRKT